MVSIDGFTRNHGDGWDGRVLSHYVIEERELHEMDELPEGFTDGIWQRFTRQCELAEMPAEVKKEYISTMTTEIDRRAQEKYAQKEARKLREEIRKEREEMLKEKSQLCEEKKTARAEGRTEGRAELVRTMFSNGMDTIEIARVTGLSVESIEEAVKD